MERTFTDTHAWLIAVTVAFAMFVGWLLGRWQGQRVRVELKSRGQTPVSKFEDASLAILGLLLAFTFSMALGKHDQRRMMVVADANAIGDFYVCAGLLKEPVRTKLRSVIHDYVALRVELSQHRYDEATFESALRQFQQMHKQMVELVSQALENGTPIAISLTNAFNAVTSSHAARVAAIRDRLPASIVLLLLLSAVISAFLVGRDQAATDQYDLAGTVCFVMLVSFIIFVTLDLNQPDRGLITVSQEPIQRLLSTMSE